MALSLRAEQKSINSIYAGGDDVYVIPNYQRPYSWGKDVCYQLYSDITDAYMNKDDYFVGNIVMAKGMDDKKRPNVVDGQQRLVTLWLFLKVLTLLHPDKNRLQRTLVVQSLLSDEDEPRINSKVYEHKDQDNIATVLGYTLNDFERQYQTNADTKGNIQIGAECSRIEANALYIYKWFSGFYENLKDDAKKEDFLKFFLEHVYLLPIELEGETLEDAASRALTIFETINNRGQSLEDSDIFKARLYEQAQKAHKEEDFIRQWLEFTNTCQDMNITVDDLFRYYYHILRGKDGQTSNESGLREYFTGTGNSALSIRSYDDIIEDLNYIIYFISWMQSQKNAESPYGRWLQVLDLYTNQYPKYALVNYLYYYGVEDSKNLLSFIQMLVRYYYYRGATLQVKYETYRLNKMIAINEKFPTYDCGDFDMMSLEHIGLLRNGFALLAHYLQHPDSYIENVFFDRAVYEREMVLLPGNWDGVDYETIRNNIANIVALDLPKRTFRTLQQKRVYYSTSKVPEIRKIFDSDGTINRESFQKREKSLKKTLLSFFQQK